MPWGRNPRFGSSTPVLEYTRSRSTEAAMAREATLRMKLDSTSNGEYRAGLG